MDRSRTSRGSRRASNNNMDTNTHNGYEHIEVIDLTSPDREDLNDRENNISFSLHESNARNNTQNVRSPDSLCAELTLSLLGQTISVHSELSLSQLGQTIRGSTGRMTMLLNIIPHLSTDIGGSSSTRGVPFNLISQPSENIGGSNSLITIPFISSLRGSSSTSATRQIQIESQTLDVDPSMSLSLHIDNHRARAQASEDPPSHPRTTPTQPQRTVEIDLGGRRVQAAPVELTSTRRETRTPTCHSMDASYIYLHKLVDEETDGMEIDVNWPTVKSGDYLKLRNSHGTLAIWSRDEIIEKSREFLINLLSYRLIQDECNCSMCRPHRPYQTVYPDSGDSDGDDIEIAELDMDAVVQDGFEMYTESDDGYLLDMDAPVADEAPINNEVEMSYEEMTALQDEIGYVERGVPNELINQALRKERYQPPVPCLGSLAMPRRRARGRSSTTPICSICWEEYKPRLVTGIMNCGHSFHYRCIRPWLRRKDTCPLCRKPALER